jgi:hypothetical protein
MRSGGATLDVEVAVLLLGVLNKTLHDVSQMAKIMPVIDKVDNNRIVRLT